MKYCSDTWFILKLFSKDEKAKQIIKNVKYGKDELFVPMIVVSESYKKLMQKGVREKRINQFFDSLELSSKIEFIPSDKKIAKEAAKMSLSQRIPLIDSIIATTSNLLGCHFVLTAGQHIKNLKKIKVKVW